MLVILFILVTTLCLGIPYVNAAIKDTQSEVVEFSDIINTKNQFADIQTSNLTGTSSKSASTMQQNLSRGTIPNVKNISPVLYEIKVKFDRLDVIDDHDLVGEGEYDIVAYVQGQKVDLTEASYTRDICAGWGCGPGLLDADDGEQFYFKPGTEITVYLRPSRTLSIFTIGEELDNCDRLLYPRTLERELFSILSVPDEDYWLRAVREIQRTTIEENPIADVSWWCAHNLNDELGKITGFITVPQLIAEANYPPPGDGIAYFTPPSDTGDFTLYTTISIIPVLFGPVESQTNYDFATKLNNNFSSGTFTPSK
jgi:hypothetical protein